MGIFGEKLGLLLNLAGERIDFVGRGRPVMAAGMMLQLAVKFIVPIGVVMEHQASGRRVDGDLFDPGNDDEGLLHCSSSSGLPLADANFMRTRPGTWCAICSFVLVMNGSRSSGRMRRKLVLRLRGRDDSQPRFKSTAAIEPLAGDGRRTLRGISTGSDCNCLRRLRLGTVAFGPHFGDDVVDVLVGLGEHFFRLLRELVGSADG